LEKYVKYVLTKAHTEKCPKSNQEYEEDTHLEDGRSVYPKNKSLKEKKKKEKKQKESA
jgi:hypothetical protein